MDVLRIHGHVLDLGMHEKFVRWRKCVIVKNLVRGYEKCDIITTIKNVKMLHWS